MTNCTSDNLVQHSFNLNNSFHVTDFGSFDIYVVTADSVVLSFCMVEKVILLYQKVQLLSGVKLVSVLIIFS